MAVCGEVCVCSSATAKPAGSSSTNWLTTSSARAWLPVSSTRVRAWGSIHTHIDPILVKAMGRRSSLASSLRSRFSFLPGLRPVSRSIWSTLSCTLRASTLPGSTLASTMKRRIHCPPTLSASGPWASPRGGTKPTARSCVAPHAANVAFCKASSNVSNPTCHCGAMRYTIMFLNTQTFQYPAVRPKCYEFNSYWRLSIVPLSQFFLKN